MYWVIWFCGMSSGVKFDKKVVNCLICSNTLGRYFTRASTIMVIRARYNTIIMTLLFTRIYLLIRFVSRT
ncbi:hypothetical protein D3C74_368210 [compost metagenome]